MTILHLKILENIESTKSYKSSLKKSSHRYTEVLKFWSFFGGFFLNRFTLQHKLHLQTLHNRDNTTLSIFSKFKINIYMIGNCYCSIF